MRITGLTKFLAGSAIFLACPVFADDRPNVVLAIADDWGWPHASAYGDSGIKTPVFDRLAQEGVLFENAYISSPSCTPSRGAIITGQHFWRLGQAGNLWSVWPSQIPEYPKLLEAKGYFVGSYRKGWGPGRHPYSAVNPAGRRYETVDDFFESRPPNSPFCFWFGTGDPHRPYTTGQGVGSGIDLDKVHLFEHYPDVEQVRSDIADYYWEVERFDREVGALVQRLKEMGELDNTIIVMTSDHGMPFPRGKANLYDAGTRVPLAIRWPRHVSAGRRENAFVSTIDLAPTFLEAAGLRAPVDMSGRSLLPVLVSGGSEHFGRKRDHVIFGRERHTQAQEAPDSGGYPARAIRTARYLYIRNFRPNRWPAGTPNYKKAFVKNAWLADCDNGPTKWYIWSHRNDSTVKQYYRLAFGMRPAEELYDLDKDPGQLRNVANDKKYATIQKDLAVRLFESLRAANDPRLQGRGELFDLQLYLGSGPKYPD